MSRANDFAKFGTNLTPEAVVVPLTLKPGLASRFLALKEFRTFTIEECVKLAKRLTRNRIPVKDKAVAIALILGAKGKDLA